MKGILWVDSHKECIVYFISNDKAGEITIVTIN